MKRGRKILAIVLAVLVLAISLFFVGFSAAEAGHDCAGDSCPVCECMAVANRVLKTVAKVAAVSAALAVFAALLICIGREDTAFLRKNTLVSWKVKLSN